MNVYQAWVKYAREELLVGINMARHLWRTRHCKSDVCGVSEAAAFEAGWKANE